MYINFNYYVEKCEALGKEQLDNQQNAEVQRERYYATIHKVTLQPGEKIPGKLKNYKILLKCIINSNVFCT